MLLDKAFTTPPPRDVLLELSRAKNNTPLPLIKPHCGLRLPPDRYCLSSCNYKLRAAQQLVKTTTFRKRPGIGGDNVFANRAILKGRKDKPSALQRSGGIGTVPLKSQTVQIPKPLFKFSSTTAPNVQKTIKREPLDIKIEPMESDDASVGKRKRDEDDFEIV